MTDKQIQALDTWSALALCHRLKIRTTGRKPAILTRLQIYGNAHPQELEAAYNRTPPSVGI